MAPALSSGPLDDVLSFQWDPEVLLIDSLQPNDHLIDHPTHLIDTHDGITRQPPRALPCVTGRKWAHQFTTYNPFWRQKLPAIAGHMGSIPGLGRCHMLHSHQACAPQLQSQCSRDHRRQLLNTVEPVLKRSTTTTLRSPCTAKKSSPLSPQLEKVLAHQGFPDSSVGKESTCNAGNPSSIPRSGRSPGEGIGHPLQYSWASLMAQLVKNLPAM